MLWNALLSLCFVLWRVLMFCLCLFCPVVHRVVRVERCVNKRKKQKSESCRHWGAGRYSGSGGDTLTPVSEKRPGD